jgi:chloramphenicol 3-O-phosphotransferase
VETYGGIEPVTIDRKDESISLDVIVIAGAPGAGKTTVCRALHVQMQGPYIELGQHLRQLHLDPGWHTASPREEQMSFENLLAITRNYLKYGYTPVIVTDLEDFRILEIPSLFSEHRYRIITLVCSNEELERRVLTPTRDSGYRDVRRTQEWNAIAKARPLVRNEHRLDTTGQTIEETVQAVRRLIGQR